MQYLQEIYAQSVIIKLSPLHPLEMIMFGHLIRAEYEELHRFPSRRIFLVQKPLETPGDGIIILIIRVNDRIWDSRRKSL